MVPKGHPQVEGALESGEDGRGENGPTEFSD